TKVSVFPAVESLLKSDVSLYGFVPADAQPPYIVYEETGQNWSFPEVMKGTITFFLKAVSTYKGAQEINQMITLLKEKLEGKEVSIESRSKGFFRFVQQKMVL